MENTNLLLDLCIEAAIKAGAKTLQYFEKSIDIRIKQDLSPVTIADLESNKIINQFLQKTSIPVMSEENKLLPFSERKKWERFWLVDPLDGTKEFIKHNSDYTVNIALIEKDTPVLGVVYAPSLKTLYFATEETGGFKCSTRNHKMVEVLRSDAVKLPCIAEDHLKVVISRSHHSNETKKFLDELQKNHYDYTVCSIGSSLKVCMVAEGSAHIYPRYEPTMEWDIAASHAIAKYSDCRIINILTKKEMKYNKENLVNDGFVICSRDSLSIVQEILSF